MRVAVITFGCRVNQADSQQIEEALLARGARPSGPSDAELVIVNTCSVTAAAEQGARQAIRRIARENPGARIVVTGCYATRRDSAVAALPGVSDVVSNDRKARLVPEISAECCVGRAEGRTAGDFAPGLAGRTVHTLRVQTGCDEHCTYCIVPSTRGRARSEPIDTVLADVRRAILAGFKEIVLTGVHLGSFGRDLAQPTSLLRLLQVLAEQISSDVLFRIGSLEPMDCTDEIVDLVSRSRRFAPHFHLPLQHASDGILSAMRRPSSLQSYDGLVRTVRRRIPEAAIGCDVIVGFPGERAADFEVLLDYLRASPLTHVHVFPYSDRPGTDAAVLPDKVHGAEIRKRAQLVREAAWGLTWHFRQTQLGTVRPALTIGDGSLAMTDNYLTVKVAPGHARNERILVRVAAAGEDLAGEVV